MNLAIIVEFESGETRPLMLDVDDETSGSTVLRAVLAHLRQPDDTSGWLRRTGAALSATTTVSSLGLRDGDVVVLGKPSGAVGESVAATSASYELIVVGGPAEKRRFPLTTGTVRVGRSPDADISIGDDPTVSWLHAVVTVNESGVAIEDLGSMNGTWIDGCEVTATAEVAFGQVVEIGDTLLVVQMANGREPGALTWRSGSLAFNRPPRVSKPFAPASFKAPVPPVRPPRQRIPLAASLVPLLLGGVMALVLGNYTYLLFCLIGPLMAISNVFSNRRSGRTAFRSEEAQFESAVSRLAIDVAAAHSAEVAARRDSAPSPTDLLDRADVRSADLWERRIQDADFVNLRVGVADRPTKLTIELPTTGDDDFLERVHALADDYSVDASVPVTVDLRAYAVAGVVGSADSANALLRWLVLQAAVLCSPAELAIVAFVPEDEMAQWAWLSWLPHTSTLANELGEIAVAGDAGRTVATGVAASRLFDRIEAYVASRRANAGGATGERSSPHVLVLAPETPPTIAPRWHALLQTAPAVAMSVACGAQTREDLPGACSVIVNTNSDGTTVTFAESGEVVDSIIVDAASTKECARAALALAPLRDAGAPGRGAGVPARVLLNELPSMERIDTFAITERWQAPTDGKLSAPIGMCVSGPTSISLRDDGPHMLVAGTSGSGKSEFLQTFVLALAACHPPNRLALMLFDFKGEAAFGPLEELPHVLDVLSDLSPALTSRALTSLRAEAARRESLFGELRVKDLESLEELHPELAPPAMVIVFDEFNLLKDSLPDFLNGIADLLRRGRSLGMHVILSTQSPEGVVDQAMRANIKLKVALATVNAAQSMSILERPDASATGSPKGRAWVQVGTGEPTVVQTAYTSAEVDGRVRAARVADFDLSGARWPREDGPSDRRARPRTLADELKQAISAAAAEIGWNRLASPSRPPLRDHYAISELLGRAPEPVEGSLATPIGVSDDPERQRQDDLVIDLAADGHLLVYGTAGSGTTTLLRTIVFGLASRYDATHCELYAVDFGARLLAPLAALPSCGGVISGDDTELVERLFARSRWSHAHTKGLARP